MALDRIGYGDKTDQYSSYKNPKFRSFTGTNPAANTEISETVPAGKAWLLLSVTLTNAQAGAGATQPILQIKDPAGVVIFENFGSTTTQAISTTCRYSWSSGGGAPSALVGATTGVHAVSGLPDALYLPAGSTIGTSSVGLSASTDFAAPQITVLEYS